MALRKIAKSSKHLKKGKKLEETKPLTTATGSSLGAACSGGKHIVTGNLTGR
jgi:hypothetical protein